MIGLAYQAGRPVAICADREFGPGDDFLLSQQVGPANGVTAQVWCPEGHEIIREFSATQPYATLEVITDIVRKPVDSDVVSVGTRPYVRLSRSTGRADLATMLTVGVVCRPLL